MSRITPDHLARQAYVYVRQSTPDQLLHNHESRRSRTVADFRTDGLGRARSLGDDGRTAGPAGDSA